MKPIKLTQQTRKELLTKFEKYLNDLRMTSNTINFTQTTTNSLPKLDEPIKLYINAEAYLKMLLYVRDTKTELGWHGTVKRTDTGDAYWITDVVLYPQTVTGVTVDTDQAAYEKWLENLNDDAFNHLRFQGHSHVNMGVHPSTVDENYYDKMLQPLPEDAYYIFTIMNKAGDTFWRIYDLKKNIVYETEDIKVIVLSTDKKSNLLENITDEKTKHISTKTKFEHTPYYYTPSDTSYQLGAKHTDNEAWIRALDEEYKAVLEAYTPTSKRKKVKK